MKIDREQVRNKFGGKCAYTGTPLEQDWQVDHVIPQYRFKERFVQGNANDLSNLIPCQRIVNHYKRGHDLEGFREYMFGFHIRLGKLPKKTTRPQTIKRIEYMLKIAALFDITPEKPFNGIFYFESAADFPQQQNTKVR
jgi:5-methylcytosine-specific restriction endonuclease McrA